MIAVGNTTRTDAQKLSVSGTTGVHTVEDGIMDFTIVEKG